MPAPDPALLFSWCRPGSGNAGRRPGETQGPQIHLERGGKEMVEETKTGSLCQMLVHDTSAARVCV